MLLFEISRHVYGANWPNGASLINTWLRTHQVLPTGAANFPPVPLQPQVWMDQGLRQSSFLSMCLLDYPWDWKQLLFHYRIQHATEFFWMWRAEQPRQRWLSSGHLSTQQPSLNFPHQHIDFSNESWVKRSHLMVTWMQTSWLSQNHWKGGTIL
jgi:hypothetical protein